MPLHYSSKGSIQGREKYRSVTVRRSVLNCCEVGYGLLLLLSSPTGAGRLSVALIARARGVDFELGRAVEGNLATTRGLRVLRATNAL